MRSQARGKQFNLLFFFSLLFSYELHVTWNGNMKKMCFEVKKKSCKKTCFLCVGDENWTCEFLSTWRDTNERFVVVWGKNRMQSPKKNWVEKFSVAVERCYEHQKYSMWHRDQRVYLIHLRHIIINKKVNKSFKNRQKFIHFTSLFMFL